MCKYILKNGRQCKKGIGKDLCHIHVNQQKIANIKAQEMKDACLIITLNQKIDILTKISGTQSDLIKNNKKAYDELYNQHIKNIERLKTCEAEHNLLLTFADKMNQQYTNAKNEIKNLNKTIEKKNNTIASISEVRSKQASNLVDMQKEMHTMKIDYDKYQIIKEFELEKKRLINDGIDIYNYYDNDFHNKRFNRNLVAHLAC